jgi:hypothetical protein
MPRDAVFDLRKTGGCPVARRVLVQSDAIMFKALASLFGKQAPKSPATDPDDAAIQRDEAPIYGSLAMTEELREALFPTTPKMVSTIFDRSATQKPESAPASAPQPYSRPQDHGMPILE